MEVFAKLAMLLHEQLQELSEVQERLRSEIEQPCGWRFSNLDHLFDLRRDKLMRLSRFMGNQAVTTFIDNHRGQEMQEDWQRACVSTLDNARAACRALLDADDGMDGSYDSHGPDYLSDRVDEATGLAAWACMCQRLHATEPM